MRFVLESEGQELKEGAVSRPYENLGLALPRLRFFATFYSNAKSRKREKLSLRTPSTPPWPSEQDLLWAGAVGIQWRTWLCRAVGAARVTEARFSSLRQFALLRVIYALVNEITVNEGAATAYLSTFWYRLISKQRNIFEFLHNCCFWKNILLFYLLYVIKCESALLPVLLSRCL